MLPARSERGSAATLLLVALLLAGLAALGALFLFGTHRRTVRDESATRPAAEQAATQAEMIEARIGDARALVADVDSAGDPERAELLAEIAALKAEVERLEAELDALRAELAEDR